MTKVTPVMKNRMLALKEMGLRVVEISRNMEVSYNTVKYHINPEYNANHKKWTKDWNNKEYRTNPGFRERVKGYDKKWRKANPEKVKAACRKYQLKKSVERIAREQGWV